MSWQDALLTLVDDHLAGRLDETGGLELERLLGEQPAARQLFWIAVNHEVMLRSALSGAVATAGAGPVPTTTRGWWRRPALAAAALVLIAVGMALSGVLTPPPPALAQVAAMTAVGEAGVLHHADGHDVGLRVGLTIAAGDRIDLTDGASIDLRWLDEDTVITLAGGSRASVPDHGADGVADARGWLRLDHGSLVAAVAHQAPGRRFAISTPQAEVTVIGTRFAVRTGDERTEVDVEQGRVRVATPGGEQAVEVGAGERAERSRGQAPALVPGTTWRWADRRPLGVMMLCSAHPGWATNPRGWLNDPTIDVTTPAGVAAFERRLDGLIDLTIELLRAQDAQGVVFWDLEGRQHVVSYVGDPRQLARFAPEMEAYADRMFARLRAAGFAVGMVLRAQAAVWEADGIPQVRTVQDPAGLLGDKIAYARQRWGATLFPLLGQSGSAMGMETICRRVIAHQPDILLMPTAADADTYRWCGPWQDAQAPSTPDPVAARRVVPGAFGVYKALDAPQLEQQFDELVHAAAAGDILTFRAWWRDPGNAVLTRIRAAARAAPQP